jgi:hypothetical protein
VGFCLLTIQKSPKSEKIEFLILELLPLPAQQTRFFVFVGRGDLLHFCTVNEKQRRRSEEERTTLTTGFETFHEIIYGKSERGANERRVFFVPAQTESWPRSYVF